MTYTPVRELAVGGMASVMLARDAAGEVVVIKRTLKKSASDERRLVEEARIGRRLRHPAIVRTLDVIELEGRPAVVLEYVRGLSMAALRGAGPMPPELVAVVGQQIAEGLVAVHHARDEVGRLLDVLHRDVTPANIIVGLDGQAKLIDLGIARSRDSNVTRTQTGEVRGTLRYLSPELLENASQSRGSDLWSLGIVLLEAAMGAPLHRGTTAEVLRRILTHDPLRLASAAGVAPWLLDAVAPVLVRDPAAREQDGALLAARLAASKVAGSAQASAPEVAEYVGAVARGELVRTEVVARPAAPTDTPTERQAPPAQREGVLEPNEDDESWSELLDARQAIDAWEQGRSLDGVTRATGLDPPAPPTPTRVRAPIAAVAAAAVLLAGASFVLEPPEPVTPVLDVSGPHGRKTARLAAEREQRNRERQRQAVRLDVLRHQELAWARLVGPHVELVPLISRGSTWRYSDVGGDLGVAWRAARYDDSRWPQGAGRLGYGRDGEVTRLSFGPDPANKPVTVYFRRTFTVGRQFNRLALRLIRDDGAAVYLNGVEIARIGLPPAATYHDLALDSVDPEKVVNREQDYYPVVVPAKLLKKGANVLAVEVHQVRSSSPDLGFDLEAFGIVDGKPGQPTKMIEVAAPPVVEGPPPAARFGTF